MHVHHYLCWKTSSEFAPRYVTPAGRAPHTVSTKRGRKSGDLNDGRSLGGARRPGAGGLLQWVPHLQRARAPLGESEGTVPNTLSSREQRLLLPCRKQSQCLQVSLGLTHSASYSPPGPPVKGSIRVSSVCPSIYLSMLIYLSPIYGPSHLFVCLSPIHPSIHPYLSGCLPTY